MTLLHFRYRSRLALLAASALRPGEAEEVRNHLDHCVSCRSEFEALRRTEEMLRLDAAFERPLPIPSEAFRTRVLAHVRAGAPPLPAEAWSPTSALSALALVVLGLLGGVLATHPMSAPIADPSSTARTEPPADTQLNNAAFYERLEKTHVRANAARYLAEAQDVLIQVTAAADCPDSPKDSVDVRREAQTSRSLLRRRAALVSGSGETLTAARGVMEEVEGVLQQVADLPQCTRRTDVDAIARKVDRKNLLMKIDMISQELAAP